MIFTDLYAAESASNDFTRRRDHGKRIGIDLLNLFTQTDGIDSVANGVDHRLIRTAEAADDLVRGHAVIQLADNEFGNLVGHIGNYDSRYGYRLTWKEYACIPKGT